MIKLHNGTWNTHILCEARKLTKQINKCAKNIVVYFNNIMSIQIVPKPASVSLIQMWYINDIDAGFGNFCELIRGALTTTRKIQVTMVLGNCNAKVGSKPVNKLLERNERWDMLIQNHEKWTKNLPYKLPEFWRRLLRNFE